MPCRTRSLPLHGHSRRVFITGASGFIGRALAERYRQAGAEVRGMDGMERTLAWLRAGGLLTR